MIYPSETEPSSEALSCGVTGNGEGGEAREEVLIRTAQRHGRVPLIVLRRSRRSMCVVRAICSVGSDCDSRVCVYTTESAEKISGLEVIISLNVAMAK